MYVGNEVFLDVQRDVSSLLYGYREMKSKCMISC